MAIATSKVARLLNESCFIRKTLVSSVFFCLISCSSPSCPQWEKVIIDNPCFKSERWVFPCVSEYSGLELEYTQYPAPTGDRFFVNLYGPKISTPDPEVHIIFGETCYTYQGELFLGGQRIMLPVEANEVILQAIEENTSFTVQVLRFQSTIQ